MHTVSLRISLGIIVAVDTIVEYARRKKLTARWSYPLLMAAVLFCVGLALLFATDLAPPPVKPKLALAAMVGLVISCMAYLYVSSRYNRCPNCEAIPRGRAGGVIFDPYACPSCGARLRRSGSSV